MPSRKDRVVSISSVQINLLQDAGLARGAQVKGEVFVFFFCFFCFVLFFLFFFVFFLFFVFCFLFLFFVFIYFFF